MSEDTEVTEEPTVQPDSDEKTKANDQEAMKSRFKLIEGEEVLLTKQPSGVGFLNMYVLGLLVFGVHIIFWKPDMLVNDESGGIAKAIVWLMELGGSKLPFGFVLVMASITWFNRMLNSSTSGKWVTVWLLIATLLPVLIQIDGLIALIRDLFSDTDVEPFLGFEYNFLFAGIALTLAFWGLVFYYQRSFDYAITSNAVIFKHAFLLSRAHRRILFDRISEVQVERTPVGTMTGYATLTILTDSGVGIVEESVGGRSAFLQMYQQTRTMAMSKRLGRALFGPSLLSCFINEQFEQSVQIQSTVSSKSVVGKIPRRCLTRCIKSIASRQNWTILLRF